MATDQLMVAGGPRYVQMKSSPPPSPPAPGEISPAPSFRQGGAEPPNRIFDELPKATIVSVSRPDAGDISPMQLSYTIQVQYKQVRLHLFMNSSNSCSILMSDCKHWIQLCVQEAMMIDEYHRDWIWIICLNLIACLVALYVLKLANLAEGLLWTRNAQCNSSAVCLCFPQKLLLRLTSLDFSF